MRSGGSGGRRGGGGSGGRWSCPRCWLANARDNVFASPVHAEDPTAHPSLFLANVSIGLARMKQATKPGITEQNRTEQNSRTEHEGSRIFCRAILFSAAQAEGMCESRPERVELVPEPLPLPLVRILGFAPFSPACQERGQSEAGGAMPATRGTCVLVASPRKRGWCEGCIRPFAGVPARSLLRLAAQGRPRDCSSPRRLGFYFRRGNSPRFVGTPSLTGMNERRAIRPNPLPHLAPPILPAPTKQDFGTSARQLPWRPSTIHPSGKPSPTTPRSQMAQIR